MKKALVIAAVVMSVMACNNPNPGESGAVDDGMHAVDSNGALQDTSNRPYTPQTDTAIGEDRVDVQPRGDTSK